MAKIQEKVIVKNFLKPDEVRTFEKGKIELLKVNGTMVGKATLQPGWRWSAHVKPIAKTAFCEAPHFQYIVSGKMTLKTEGGEEHTVKAGDVLKIGAGHDAWVTGSEPLIAVDFQGLADYAKPK